MRKLVVLSVFVMVFSSIAGGVASASSDGIADADMRQVVDVGEAEPNTWRPRTPTVTFCYDFSYDPINPYHKQLYLSVGGECGPLAPLSLTFPTTSTVKLCASKYTAHLKYVTNSSFSCGGPSSWTFVLPQDGSVPYCANLGTKIVKVNFSGNACGGYHVEGVIYP